MALPCNGEGIYTLSPGHFHIGRPIELLPDPSFSYYPIDRFVPEHSQPVLVTMETRISDQPKGMPSGTKPTRNISIVVLHDGNLVPTKWSLGKVLRTINGNDG